MENETLCQTESKLGNDAVSGLIRRQRLTRGSELTTFGHWEMLRRRKRKTYVEKECHHHPKIGYSTCTIRRVPRTKPAPQMCRAINSFIPRAHIRMPYLYGHHAVARARRVIRETSKRIQTLIPKQMDRGKWFSRKP